MKNFSTVQWLPFLLVLVLGGCAMQAPNGSSSQPEEDPPVSMPDPPPVPPEGLEEYTVVKIFYGTDRERNETGDPGDVYGGRRRRSADPEDRVEYGTARVSIPREHKLGELESPKWYRLEFREDPAKHVVLLSVEPGSATAVLAELRTAVAGAEAQELLVFIHGFNVSFEDAARRTAQIAYDLSFPGIPALYSWPSDGKVVNYTADESDAQWSASNLRAFLETIHETSGAQRIHLIAHSMGNRVLTAALQGIAGGLGTEDEDPPFNQVVLTAPDIDADVFRRDIAPAILPTAERVTLYASSDDRALVASKKLHGGYPRAGESGVGLVVVAGIDTIDASGIDTDLLGHSYFAETEPVLADLVSLLHHRLSPDRRTLSPEPPEAPRYWRLAH